MSENQRPSGLIRIFSNRILFLLHLFVYVAVNLLLVLIWAVSLPLLPTTYFVPFLPIFGWGFGMGFHALIYLMYNDKIKYLSELRTQSGFKILFIFHAWFYISINVFLLILNLTTLDLFNSIWFFWPLGGWGVAFGFHAFGFFTWDKSFTQQKEKLRAKYPDYSDQRLKELATSKLLGIEILLLHITYFVIVAVLSYASQIWVILSYTIESVIQTTIGWALFLGLHVLAYYLFNYNEKLSTVMKGLILHIIAYVGLIFIGLWEQLSRLAIDSSAIFWWHIPVILWAFFIGIHILVTLKWDSINPNALEKVKSRSREGLEEYKYQRLTYWVLFWQFTFIAHIFAYILGLIFIFPLTTGFAATLSVYFAVEALDLLAIIAFGWLMGLLVHGAMYIVAVKQIRGFLMWTAVLHIAAYIGAIPLLITINLLFMPALLWSAIALGGWAILLGAHLLIAKLTQKK